MGVGSRESGVGSRESGVGNRQSMTLQPRYSGCYPNEVHIIFVLFPVPCSLKP
ncbi:hypothetical protein [Moorena producens]|uniref:hypothetical protein n=1 Tax=Moorena producens TaxID=1155739 RepID=UPI001314E648|nr:hypothetical protein [Moorena producens]